MNVLFMIAITTGLLSGIWGWIAITLGLIGWAGFLGYAACFASPISGFRGFLITALTCCSGVFWGEMIKMGSALRPEWSILGYVVIGLVGFAMCMQSTYQWLAFLPGTFIGASAALASPQNWQAVIVSLLLGLIFAYAMKLSGMWLLHKQQALSEARLKAKTPPVAYSVVSGSEGS